MAETLIYLAIALIVGWVILDILSHTYVRTCRKEGYQPSDKRVTKDLRPPKGGTSIKKSEED